MGLLDLYASQADTSAPSPLQALPRSLGERLEATAAETFSPDRYFMIAGARRDMWQRSIDELHAATGQTFENPYGAVSSEEMMRLGNQPAITAERSQKIIDASRLARAQGNDDLFDPENIDRYIGEEATRRRQTSAVYEGTGNGILNFLGGAAMASIEPVNVLALGIPVSRLPLAASSVIGETFLRNVAREAALQAGVNVGLQGVTEALDYTSRRETGTPQTAGEIAANLAGAAVFGGAIGGGIRALHLRWLGLPEKVRESAPLEVKDAFRAIEADAIYSGQNRLGVDSMLHERYQGNAMDAVLRGRPVDFAELNRTADTPLTALGTILQRTPDQIRVEGLGGLSAALDRTRALPDSEIEAFARETKPNSFARIDKVDAQLTELKTRLQEIETRSPVDMLDPETAQRVQEIDRNLSAPALTSRRREALEDERAMIMDTVNPNGKMDREVAKTQRSERVEVQKQIDRLERQREEARATADAATADLRRKLGRYEELLGTPRTALEQAVKSADDIYRDARAGRNPKLAEQGAGTRETKAFTTWFSGSKVVNDDGSPLIVYHGTTNAFEKFDMSRAGEATGAPSAKEGLFFAKSPDVAASYAAVIDPYHDYDNLLGRVISTIDKLTAGYYKKFNEAIVALIHGPRPVEAPNIRPTYVQMRNPKVVDQGGKEFREESYFDAIRKAKDDGHDGVIFKDTFDPGFKGGEEKTDIYVVFSPEQTRAFSERFDPRDTIAFDLGVPDAPTLAEAILRADTLRQARMMREVLPEGAAAPVRPVERPAPAGEAIIDPEHQQALKAEVDRILEAGPVDRGLRADLDRADQAMADVRAAMRCVMAGGIP